LLEEGIYVIGFFYPVVAKGPSAAYRVLVRVLRMNSNIMDKAIAAFAKIGKELGVLKVAEV
jgi:glycine C-acetyltransferase